jgi:hypothetical protein
MLLSHVFAVVWLGSDSDFFQPTRRETGGFRFIPQFRIESRLAPIR